MFISPLRCVRPFKKRNIPETKTEDSEGVRTNNVNGKQRGKKKQTKKKKEQLQSLVEAAVAIFPLPTKYSQMFVKLRIYCCFTVYY